MPLSDRDALNTANLPYTTDSIIKLKASAIDTSNREQSALHVKVKQQQRPWTLSCGMVVGIPDNVEGKAKIESLGPEDEAFLKMFDRRYAEQIRQDNHIDTWSEDIELEFLTGLISGKVKDFLEKLQTVPNLQRDTGDDWDAAKNEAYLAAELRKCFNSEIATYDRLQEYQGKFIPRFLTAVSLDVLLPNLALDMEEQELYKQYGILLQYLAGFSLSTMVENAPEASWQGIVDQAIRIVHILGDYDILNADVRPENFIIVPKDEAYQVFMIDFGQCRLRHEDESDADWGRAKWIQDEEGAIGAVMKMRLSKIGFELNFEPSWRYLAWAPREDDD